MKYYIPSENKGKIVLPIGIENKWDSHMYKSIFFYSEYCGVDSTELKNTEPNAMLTFDIANTYFQIPDGPKVDNLKIAVNIRFKKKSRGTLPFNSGISHSEETDSSLPAPTIIPGDVRLRREE